MILETERLRLRQLTGDDRGDLCEILQDAQAMYAYEHAFSDTEVDEWLARQLTRYEQDGFGLWAVVRREDGVFLGQCGITTQELDGRRVPEIGYLFKRCFWHMGYATEAAVACREYGFNALDMEELYSIIRENNAPSRAVAERNGMAVAGRQLKHYYGVDMPHIVYRVRRCEDGTG